MAQPALEPIEEFCSRLTSTIAGVNAIWLFGSRANGTSRIDSDWDLLVFGDGEVCGQVRAASALHRDDVDCLIVFDGDSFESAWGRMKSGSLSSWEWKTTSAGQAEYRQTKEIQPSCGLNIECKIVKALRIWPMTDAT
ncbi:nucleotidyltransferase domain-containing protein [Massilia genomosp. 1]|uniref:Polymerase beta nucleotidyltransferase domain-containing protein n=1 Tax=Massilia genomosp. 1 TaxID=2609280 RepID=A0ABX0N3D6_9BURK|nr:nucleotidyltransferase domain-containing protein [Massilia genomosp. 1]NHZ66034.1 hypothetical protein [Massilia genomosp. 1]